jgi:hypothetical protein
MPKLIGHGPNAENRPASDLPAVEQKRLVKIPYAQKNRLPQNQVFYVYDTSDRGGIRTLAKRWYRWYALPENIACAARATDSMKIKALPLCHVTF